ncbi:MAG: hypothetical protein KIS92_13755 [Planctomycetota bacterium]|nr:hypothetical protein [Planctomycetota bacterium]
MRAVRLTWMLLLVAGLAVRGGAAAEPEASPVAEAAKKLPATFKGRPLHFIPKRAKPEKLTGDLSDPVWKTAVVIPLLEYKTGKPAAQPSEVLAFCTDEAIYFGARFGDTQAPTVLNEWAVYQNDCFELFLMPGESVRGQTYFEMAVDAQNHFNLGRLHIYPSSPPLKGATNAKPEHAAAETKGGGFTAEICLRFDELDMSEGAKGKKELWRMDLVRNRQETANDPKARYSSAPTLADRAHIATKMGYFLPETYATPELISATIERAERAKAEAAALDPKAVEAIEAAVAKLGDEAFAARTEAFEQLAKWAEADAGRATKIKEVLEAVLARAEDPELRTSGKKLLDIVRNAGDDDPPPAGAAPAKQGPGQNEQIFEK